MFSSKFDKICAYLWRYILCVACIVTSIAISGAVGIIIGCVGWYMVAHYVLEYLNTQEALHESCQIIANLIAENKKLRGETTDESVGDREDSVKS